MKDQHSNHGNPEEVQENALETKDYFEPDRCPKCGATERKSRGAYWVCPNGHWYFKRRRTPINPFEKPVCPYCLKSDQVISKGYPTFRCKRCAKHFNATVDHPDLRKLEDHLRIHSDSIVVTGDIHLPFHCPKTLEKMIEVSRYFGSRDIVIVGDLMDLDAFKRYLDRHPDIRKLGGWEYEKKITREFLELLNEHFDRIFLLIGNHELRMWKMLHASGSQTDVYEIILNDLWKEKITVSTYPFAWINDSWIVVHSKSYSRIQARNPYYLASKYLVQLAMDGKSPNGIYGLIDFHSHLGGEGTDISGKFQVANGMGLFDPQLSSWHVLKVDTFPEWRKGFMILHRNYLYRFPYHHTDWEFWRELFNAHIPPDSKA